MHPFGQVMLSRSVSYFLVGCPCLVSDNSQADDEEKKWHS